MAGEVADECLQEQWQQQQLCCVMVPLMAMGHIIPMMDLGLVLAEQGVSVTLFTTAANAERLAAAAAAAREASLPFTITALTYQVEGLPAGVGNVDQTSSFSEFMAMMSSIPQLNAPLKDHLQGFDPSRTFMVSDFCYPWTRLVSDDIGIPRYVFYSMPCFMLLCDHILPRYYGAGGAVDESEPFVVPGLPHRIELTRAQAPGLFPDPEWRRAVNDAEGTMDGIIVNTFAELEGEYLELFEKEIAKTVWPVGPLSLYHSEISEIAAARGSMPSVSSAQILEWLNRQKPQSVVYVCLGSLVKTTAAQAAEIGLGLEASGHPFIWVVSSLSSQAKEMEDWLASGFEERTKDRGIVIHGWAPQQLIISHKAIGGFVTHCGWNSCSEALAAGVPLATWPCFVDQFVNERFMVDVVGVGVAVGVKEMQWWWSDEVKVGRGRVEEVVRELMGSGEKSEKRRTRAKEIGVAARKAMQVGDGVSRRTIAALIEDARRRARERRPEV